MRHFVITQAYVARWFAAFCFTLAVEVPVYILVSRREVSVRRAALAGALCSVVTHPILWFVWPRYFHSYASYVVSGEIVVGIVESLIFFFVARPKSVALAVSASFLANAASYGLWALLKYLGWR